MGQDGVVYPGLTFACFVAFVNADCLHYRRYKAAPFVDQLLEILRTLRVPTWTKPEITPDLTTIQKVSGSLTNAVFFVSCPSAPKTRTLLLRMYGPSSGSLISRPRELHTLHVLSSKYNIGPRVYGTFENGRVEEYFDSEALTAADIRDPEVSSWIGARMAELHGVDIDAVDYDAQSQSPDGPERGVELGAKKNTRTWLPVAREVLALPGAPAEVRQSLDLDRFEHEWHLYMQWLHQKEKTEGASRRVFSHNDTQYGNLLRLRTHKEGEAAHRQVSRFCLHTPRSKFLTRCTPFFHSPHCRVIAPHPRVPASEPSPRNTEHLIPRARQIIVVDFEYASPNPAPFDIANHFHEWTANYHGPTPHILDSARYPTLQQRQNFYRAYLTHTGCHIDAPDPAIAPALSPDALAAEMAKLESQVRVWSPASHGMWAVWGVVQAREFVEGMDGEPEFDYLGYAVCRMDAFRRELRALGIPGLPVP